MWILKIDQQADTLWTELIRSTNGSEGYSVIQTPDNGFAVTGSAASSGTGPDVWVIRLKPEGTSGIEDEKFELPKTFALNQNYLNPFNPSTKIKYSIPSVTLSGVEGSRVQLKVYDMLGNEVATLVNEYKPAGSYEFFFDASSFTSGVYFYKLQIGEFVQTRKMTLMK